MLDYLFTAQFNDGTVLQQDQNDTSSIEPGRSQFYDVLQRENELVAFVLGGNDHQYGVDIRDGHFEIDGVQFLTYDMPVENRRLIFFRRHTHSIGPEEQTHSVEYHMGWQGNLPDTGENIQRVIIIS